MIDSTKVLASVVVADVVLALEFKPADLWVGAYTAQNGGMRHVWVCLLPCLPVHVSWVGR